MSLIRTTLKHEPNSRFTLLYGNRDSSSVIFLEALAGLKDKHLGRFEIYHFLDARKSRTSSCSTECSIESGWRRRFRRLVPDAAEVDGWFICGPGPMMDAAEGVLLDRNVAEGPDPHRALHRGPPAGGRRARDRAAPDAGGGRHASRSRSTAARGASPFTAGNILDSARASGLPAPFACKAGVCATCRAKVTKGKVEMAARYGLTDEEVAAGYVLTCQSVPLGDGVAVDYDA